MTYQGIFLYSYHDILVLVYATWSNTYDNSLIPGQIIRTTLALLALLQFGTLDSSAHNQNKFEPETLFQGQGGQFFFKLFNIQVFAKFYFFLNFGSILVSNNF